MAKKRSPGRPKKPADQRRGADLRIPVTVEEKERIVQAAQKAGETGELASWARNILLAAAKRVLQ